MNDDEERHTAATSASDESEGDVIGELRLLRSRSADDLDHDLDRDLDHEGSVQWDALIELIEVCICTAPSVQAQREIEQAVVRTINEVAREEEQPQTTKNVRAPVWERVWQGFAAWLDERVRYDRE